MKAMQAPSQAYFTAARWQEALAPVFDLGLRIYLATTGELGLSTLLVLGLRGRFAAAGLFILNAVAVISYPDLSDAGRNQHLSWGLLLAVLLILSRGKWSVDAWVQHKCG